MLPQELFAEKLWIDWQYRGVPSLSRIRELLRECNLKPKKSTTDNDLSLILGRALKGICTQNSVVQRTRIVEEVDRVCVIARWEW